MHYEKVGSEVKCIETEIPFEVPDGWAWCRLKSIIELTNGISKRKGADGINTIVLRLADLVEDTINLKETRRINLTKKEIDQYSLQKNDLLFIRVNGSRLNVGKVFVFDSDLCVAYCDHLMRGKIRTSDFSSTYIKHLFGATDIRKIVEDRIVSAAGQNTISQTSLTNILIPIAPVNEQNKIVNAIALTFEQISAMEREKSDLQSIIAQAKSKILDLAIRGKLVPQDPADESASVLLERIRAEKEQLIKAGKIKRDKNESYIFRGDDKSYYEKVGDSVRNIDDEIRFDVPASWGFVRLGTAMPYEQPQPYIVTSTEYDASYPTPVLTAGKSFIIGYTNETDGIKTDLPTVIFDDFTTDSKYVNFPFKVKSSAMKILTADSSFADIKFYYYVMQKIECTHSTHKRYWISDFSQKIVPLPPLQEQKRIVAVIEAMEQRLATIMGNLN